MTKSNFIAIADGLIDFIRLHECTFNTTLDLIEAISPKLAKRNPLFDKGRFKEYIISKTQ